VKISEIFAHFPKEKIFPAQNITFQSGTLGVNWIIT
jgi:hypothetical protein